MIEKTKIKLKKGVACLLAALQIGVVAGCSQKGISEDKYNEALTTIEQLEKEKEALQEELDKGNILEEEYNEALARIEQLEKEKAALQEELNEKGSKPDIFEQELASMIGLSEDILQNDEVKKYFDEFNAYLNGYNNVSYQIKNEDGAKSINFMLDGQVIGEVFTAFETSRLIRFRYLKNECDYYCCLVMDEENKELYSFNDELSWSYEGNVFCIGERTDNYASTLESPYSAYIDFNLLNDNEEKEKLFIYLSKNEDNTYTIDINSKSAIFVADGDFVAFDISKEDFETLDNLITSYKENGEYGNALAYVGDTLIGIIQKYGKEKECQKYIDVINNNTPSYDEEENIFNDEMVKKMGIDENILANPDVQNSIKKLNNYLQNYHNLKYDAFTDTHQIFFYSDGFLRGSIIFTNEREFTVSFYHEDYSESIGVNIYGNDYPALFNKTYYIMNSKNWDFENNIYTLSETIDSEEGIYRRQIERNTEDTSTTILISTAAGMYNINILEYTWSNDQITDRQLWNYDISKEEYQRLSDLIDNYKNGYEFGDAIDYIKDALLNIIEKLATEEEYTEIKNALESEKTLVRDK